MIMGLVMKAKIMDNLLIICGWVGCLFFMSPAMFSTKIGISQTKVKRLSSLKQ